MIGSTTASEVPSPAADLVASETIPAAVRLKFSGYCADCGTWDEHGAKCIVCGYDFSGEAGAGPSE